MIFLGGAGQIGFDFRKAANWETKREDRSHNPTFMLREEGLLSLCPEAFTSGDLRMRKVGNKLKSYVRPEGSAGWSFIYELEVDYPRFVAGIAVASGRSNTAYLHFGNLVSVYSSSFRSHWIKTSYGTYKCHFLFEHTRSPHLLTRITSKVLLTQRTPQILPNR